MWRFLSLLLAFTYSATVNAARYREVCYPQLGCFNNNAPFDNSKGIVPQSPETIGTKFELYTRQNRNYANFLKYTDIQSIKRSHFDAKRPTTFLIHGFASSVHGTPWILGVKDALLSKEDVNVICVAWENGAGFPNYDNAVANIRLVAMQIKLIVDMLETLGMNLKDVHMIGHSLGAHMSGYVGALKGSKIGRITGLDPAGPNFEDVPLSVRLDKGDAMFVDVTHTDGHDFSLLDGGYGLITQSGHVDTYVNGGLSQPNCTDGINSVIDLKDLLSGRRRSLSTLFACSHNRAPYLYLESVVSSCPFTAYPCKDYATFQKGQCLDCGTNGCLSAMYRLDPAHARGKNYLNTFYAPTYCGYHYHLKLQIDGSAPRTNGALYVALVGSAGETDFVNVTETEKTISSSTKVDKLVLFRKDVGAVQAVKVKYEKNAKMAGGATSTFKVSGIEIKSGNTGRTYCSGISSRTLKDKQPERIGTHVESSGQKCDQLSGAVIG